MTRRIVWSKSARADYHAQLAYIADESPLNADLVDKRLVSAIEALAVRPIGRKGRVEGTFEKPVTKTSLIVAYMLTDDVVQILRIIHSSRDWRMGEWPKS